MFRIQSEVSGSCFAQVADIYDRKNQRENLDQNTILCYSIDYILYHTILNYTTLY